LTHCLNLIDHLFRYRFRVGFVLMFFFVRFVFVVVMVMTEAIGRLTARA
jgi:hypothetical protein